MSRRPSRRGFPASWGESILRLLPNSFSQSRCWCRRASRWIDDLMLTEGFEHMPSSEILCFGEVLWDALPEGLFLGGAPFNVACHLRATGARVTMVSRVGS